MKLLCGLFILLTSLTSAAANKTVFVQLFEWPWNDVAQECEQVLGPAGFAAVQISPPHEHFSRSQANWWERYQVVSYQLNSRSGNEAEFASMVQRCKKAGVDIYADAVLNHMTGFIDGHGYAGTQFQHFNYPGLYNYDDFHHCGRNGNDIIKNFQDLYELQNCALLDLADLKSESPSVQQTQAQYLNHLLDLGVAGLRLDAAKHIASRDIQSVLKLLNKPAYVYQELIIGSGDPITYQEYKMNGDMTAYAYPFLVGNAFKNRQASSLFSIVEGQNDLPASDDAIVFLTNHDLERGNNPEQILSIDKEPELYHLAEVFMLSWPYGYPHIYSAFRFSDKDAGPPMDFNLKTTSVFNPQGQCYVPWDCNHRTQQVAAMVEFRNLTDRFFKITDKWSNGQDQLAFGRGPAGFVVINYSQQGLNKTFKTSLAAGQYCNSLDASYVIGTSQCAQKYSVDAQGNLNLQLAPMSAAVFLTNSRNFLQWQKN